VAAAHDLFQEHPLGSPKLFEVVDPAAAADVAAEVAGCAPDEGGT
jgi:hypothetical protein